MRLSHVMAVSAAALTLALSAPGTASAATGDFSYRYQTEDGARYAMLVSPQSGVCITLPEVDDSQATDPADTPVNRTDRAAMVFTEPGCQGHSYTLQPGGPGGSDRLKVRSVLFSDAGPGGTGVAPGAVTAPDVVGV